jgi:hypothetical protein
MRRAAAIVAVALLPWSGTLRAEAVRYDLHVNAVALGSKVFAVDVSASLDPAGYLVEAALRTAGVADAVAGSEGLFRTVGRIVGNDLHPERFLVRSSGGERERRAELAWDAFGLALVEVVPPAAEENREVVPPELLRGTKDLASALLGRLMLRDGEEPCSGTLRVFDGRRRFDLELHRGPDEILKPNRYSDFAGPARRCNAHHRMIAGYRLDYIDRQKGRPPAIYSVWLAETPDRRLLLPVRLRSETWFGGFTAYLQSAKRNGAPLVAVQ